MAATAKPCTGNASTMNHTSQTRTNKRMGKTVADATRLGRIGQQLPHGRDRFGDCSWQAPGRSQAQSTAFAADRYSPCHLTLSMPTVQRTTSPTLPRPNGRGRAGLTLVVLCAAWLLQACGTAQPNRYPAPTARPLPGQVSKPAPTAPGTAATPAPGATAPTAPAPMETSPLATERQWLQSWFKDTPVLITEEPGAVGVEVPREFSFEPGRSELKAPLIAVLDKVSQSLRRLPQARLELVSAPDDDRATAATPLATQRAMQVRRYLIGRGVLASRLDPPSANRAAAVQLRMELGAP